MNILKVLTDKRLTGNIGERAAIRYLRRHRYKILEKNYVAFDNEIDIIAECKDAYAIIEVKTRTLGHTNPKEPRAASAVTPEKQRGIIKAAKCFLANHPQRQKPVRLDVIEVYLEQKRGKQRVSRINHLINTFNYNTAYRR